MQRALILLLILAIAAGAAVWAVTGNEDPVLPGTTAEDPTAPPRGAQPVTAGDRVEVGAPVGEPSHAPPPPPEPTETPDPPAPPANVTLAVCSSASREKLARFAVTFQRGLAATPLPKVRADGEHGAATLQLPPGADGELLVEADGHEPTLQAIRVPLVGEAALHLDLFLDPIARATGITLAVHDPDGLPVANVRVRASVLGEPEPGDEWADARPLWTRRAANEAGLYELPELAPGRYGIHLAAIDAEGTLLPVRPFTHTYQLTGSNGYREDVILEPGCLLTLELVDGRDQPLDPDANDVRIDLRLAGGPAVRRHWHQRNDQGLIAAVDAPPGPGPCWLDEAIAPGHYTLSVYVDGSLRLDGQRLVLLTGQRQTERIVVR